MKITFFVFCFTFISCHSFDYSSVKEQVNRIENIFYVNDSNPKHSLDLFLPSGKKSFPLVIFIHGGFWRNQDKTYLRAFTGLYHNIGIALAKKGIGCIITNYRLFPEAKLDGQLNDIASVIEWANKNSLKYGFEDVYLMGHSAGGHLAIMHSIQKPNTVKGIIALSPILDIAHMRENKEDDFNRELTIPMFGEDMKEYSKSSPITYMDNKSLDTLYLFGEKDYAFAIDQSKMLMEKLTKSKAKGEVKIIPSYDHADMVLQINKEGDRIIPLVQSYILRMRK